MRKYLAPLVLIVSIGGFFFPVLGYFLLLVFLAIFATSPFLGRWFCGNLCPRGSFCDCYLKRVSGKKKSPKFLSSMWLRIPVFIALMGFMAYRLIQAQGMFEKIGMVFVTMCAATTGIAVVLGMVWSERSWCRFCPMGTMQMIVGGKRSTLKLDSGKCIGCGICDKVCPMNLSPRKAPKDCIKCKKCVTACPKKALS